MNENVISYEETIDLKDLCVYMLRKWRIMLLAMLAGIVVFGSCKALSGPKVVADSARVKEINTLIEKNEAEMEILLTEFVVKGGIQDSAVELEYEIRMKDNSIKTLTTSLENLAGVVAAYENRLREFQELSDIAVNIEDEAEIISIMTTLQMEILKNSNQMVVVEQEIENLKEEKDFLEKYLTDIKKLQDSIQLLAEENEKLEKENPMITVFVTTADVIKSAILGAVVGVFAVCSVAFLQYYLDQKLRNASDLKECYGMCVLGDLYVPTVKKNKIDQLLDRIAGLSSTVDVDKEVTLLTARLQVLGSVAGEKKQILMTGTVAQNVLEEVAVRIGKNLSATEYEICVVQNPVYDANALLAIRQSAVVLVEARGVSVKKDIVALMEILNAAKAQVLGVIVK